MNLSIIIINYNTKDLALACIRSIKSFFPSDIEIIVVDNNSVDGSVQGIEERFPHVTILKNGNNLGFARACNQGIKLAKNDYIMLVNSDIEFFDGSYKSSLAFLEKSQKTGIIGPRLLNSDGSLQPSAFK